MGKKKGVGNKLAKMSDEERLRYMQHRAQVEEEAKRRKEQLIATFMKNKMKKEEAFTRLNTAKINEYWHQILRKISITNMKSEIKSLRSWTQKVVEIRNKLINKLMTEIDESEQQYANNFESHLSFIDKFLGTHHKRQEDIRKDFEDKNAVMLDEAAEEHNAMQQKSDFEVEYLKTIIYGTEVNFNTEMKAYKNHKTDLLEDYSTSFQVEHEAMVADYIKTMDRLWRQIYEVLNEYLNTTAVRRHHYIELKHLDDRNRFEREENERKIAHYQELINKTKANNETFQENSQNHIKILTEEQDTLRKQYELLKKNLKKDLDIFDKRLTFMTVCSNNSIEEMSLVIEKGKNILQLADCCHKLETEDEKRLNWSEMRKKWNDLHGLTDIVESSEDRIISSARKLIAKDLEPDSQISIFENASKSKSIQQENVCQEIDVFDSNISHDNSIDDSCYQTDQDLSIFEKSQTQIFEEFQYLQNLNSLCWVQNRVEIDIIDLKKEKSSLFMENKRLKEIIKGILEDAVLEPRTPKKPSLKVRPNISSAPASISSSKWGRQIPTCVVLSFD